MITVLYIALAQSAYALPWDTDLNHQQSYKTSEMARSPVKGTIPLGAKPFTLSHEDAGKNLKNPSTPTRASLWRARRLWNSNCATCHGLQGDGNSVVGPQVKAPSLKLDLYKSRTDGWIYSVIHAGLNNMPRYGYKLTEQDHWDLVNYVRYIQGQHQDLIAAQN